MPIDPYRVYKLTTVTNGTDGPFRIVVGLHPVKVNDPVFGDAGEAYSYASSSFATPYSSVLAESVDDKGAVLDIPDPDDPSTIHRLEPLTLAIWNSIKDKVGDLNSFEDHFTNDDEIQDWFYSDIMYDGLEDTLKGIESPSDATAEDDAVEEDKKETSIDIPASAKAKAKGLPVGTVHVWSDGIKHQKQHDGSWAEVHGGTRDAEKAKEALASHPQLQPSELPDEPGDEAPATPDSIAAPEATPQSAPNTNPNEPARANKGPPPPAAAEPAAQPEEDQGGWIDVAEGLPASTRDAYSKVENGTNVYIPERRALHGIIVDSALRGLTPAHNDKMPVAVLTMGLPASGKSTRAKKIWSKANVAFIDADAVKEQLPEFQQAVSQRARNAANLVHKESSDVATELLTKAIDNRYNFVLDGVGRDLDWYSKLVLDLRKRGYYVYAMMQHVTDLNKVLTRAEQRGQDQGRFIDVESTKKAFPTLPKNFRAIDRLAHSTVIADGDDPTGEPFYERHEGTDPLIHNPDKYSEFQKVSESILLRVFMNESLKATPHLPVDLPSRASYRRTEKLRRPVRKLLKSLLSMRQDRVFPGLWLTTKYSRKYPQLQVSSRLLVRSRDRLEANMPETESTRHSGQSGPPIDLPIDRMNDAEQKLLRLFAAHGDAELSIHELSLYGFPEQEKEVANSSVRNALRRLVRGEWLAKAARGRYKLTASGKRRLTEVS